MFYLTDDLEDTSKIILFFIIVITNCYFIQYWLRLYITASLMQLAVQNPKLILKICKFWPKVYQKAYEEICKFDEQRENN